MLRIDKWVNVGVDSPPLLLGWQQSSDRALAVDSDAAKRAGARVLVPPAVAAAQASWQGGCVGCLARGLRQAAVRCNAVPPAA